MAVVPAAVAGYRALGLEVGVEAGAGRGAGFADDAYRDVGAAVVSPDDVLAAEIVGTVGLLEPADVRRLRPGAVWVTLPAPPPSGALADAIGEVGATVFALERLPRLSRAQPMDALSSQATVTGYRGALLAAVRIGRFFPLLMTAAGTIPPAKVLVIGAGVAGLQAVATARRLGAVVTAHDLRPAAKGEVESLGGRFLELPALEVVEGAGGYAAAQPEEVLDRQRELLAEPVAEADAVITTAAVPGRPAPVLLSAAMVRAMRPGSLVVDLAADSGGNCELTVPGKLVTDGSVSVLGVRNPPSGLPEHASTLFARNLRNFVELLVAGDTPPGRRMEDELLGSTCVTLGGRPWPAGHPTVPSGSRPPSADGEGAHAVPVVERNEAEEAERS